MSIILSDVLTGDLNMINNGAVMSEKKAVLLFGTFNPFTNAHLHIGMLAKEKYPDYEICYVPAKAGFMTGYKGLDESSVISQDKRLEYIKGSIKDIEGFTVTDIEFGSKVSGKTIDTISYFKEDLGYSEVILCFGTDKVNELETWYKGCELVKNNKFLIVTRSGEALSDVMTEYTLRYACNFTEICNDKYSHLSGTLIREAIFKKDWEFVKKNVPEYVFRECVEERRINDSK